MKARFCKMGAEHTKTVPLNMVAQINARPALNNLPDNLEVAFVPMKCVEQLTGHLDLSIKTELGKVRKGYTAFQNGNILFAKITPCMENGKIAIANNLPNGVGFGSTEFHVIQPSKVLDAKYLLWYLLQHSIRKHAQRSMTGTAGQLRVPKKFLENLQIPLPEISEQQRIVAKIEQLFTRLDAGIESLKKIRQEIKRYRQAVLKAAFEGKLTAEWRKKNKDKVEPASKFLERIATERAKQTNGKKQKKLPPLDKSDLPELPNGWEWTRLKELAWDSGYGTSAKCDYSGNGESVLRIPNILNGKIELSDLKKSLYPLDLKHGQQLQQNDYLIIRTNGSKNLIGRSALVTKSFEALHYFASYLIRYRLMGVGNLAKWVSVIWDSQSIRNWIMRQAATSAGQYNISMGVLDMLVIPIPPDDERNVAVEEIERHLSIVDEVEQIIEKSLMHSQRLRQSILKKAFEGKLVPQDVNDEPADVLLERIQQQKVKQSSANAQKKTKPKIIKIEKRQHSKGIYFRRGAVISYIVNKLCDKNTFGRTQMEKIAHLTQYHVGIDLEFEFVRRAAGPFDEEIIKLESIAAKQQWFKTCKRSGFGHYYKRSGKINERCVVAESIFSEKKTEIDRLIAVFAKMNTDQAELFDTIYAVWNDMLIDGIEPTEDKIMDDFYGWSEEKKRFTPEQIHKGIEWMKNENFVPSGKGLKTQRVEFMSNSIK